MARLDTIKIGISSCLLGQLVRFNGGHRYDHYINEELRGRFEFVAYCPEVAIGLGVPRDPIQLVSTDGGIRVLGVHDPNLDVTKPLQQYGQQVATQLDSLSGYIFKARSPSCGIGSVKLHAPSGALLNQLGVGAYSDEIMKAHPQLPVIDEGMLADPAARDEFLARVTAYHQHLMFVP